MAIRPTDIQGSIWQASQTAPLTQRAEEAPRAAQAAAQADFAAQLHVRDERISETSESLGNRVDANAERDARGDAGEPERRAHRALEEVAGEAAGLDEPPHLIDFTA
ncbi:MAG: hypothetical protein NVS3B7_13670 [Candidatus Elarobacter sp.]